MAIYENRRPRKLDDAMGSEESIFDYATPREIAAPPPRYQSHAANGSRPASGDEESDILRAAFEDQTPTRPYAGPRSQHDRD